MVDLTFIIGIIKKFAGTIFGWIWRSIDNNDDPIRIFRKTKDVVSQPHPRIQRRFDKVDEKLELILDELAEVKAHVDYLEREITR